MIVRSDLPTVCLRILIPTPSRASWAILAAVGVIVQYVGQIQTSGIGQSRGRRGKAINRGSLGPSLRLVWFQRPRLCGSEGKGAVQLSSVAW